MRRYTASLLSLLLALSVVLLPVTGCGRSKGAGEEINSTGSSKGNGSKTADGSGEEKGADSQEQALGRYVETAYDLSDYIRRAGELVKMDDDSLWIFDFHNGILKSDDDGVTWRAEQPEWLQQMYSTQGTILDAAIAADGQIAVAFVPENEDEEESDSITLHPAYYLIAPDGTQTELSIPCGEQSYVNNFTFSDDGELYASALGGEIFAVDRTGKASRVLLVNDGYIYNMAAGKELLVYMDKNGFGLYDLNKGEETEDQTLEEFAASEFGGTLDNSSADSVLIDLIPADDNILYIVCSKGIYRHVLGGSVMEQVVDGSMNSLNNPVYNIIDSVHLADDSFLILFSGGRLMHYIYNADIPAVPGVKIRAYSLREDELLRQAISVYQSSHPENYVSYETGIEEGSSETREDALKKLNTEIVAGNGPDIIILDDMPLDSCIEKGILMDLSPYIKELEKELLPGVLNSFQTEQGLYALPAQLQLPLLVGDREDIKDISDLVSLADKAEELRQDTEAGILGTSSAEELLYMLTPVCAPAWLKEGKELDTDALRQFFIQCRRIWDAEKTGVTEKMKENYETYMQEWSPEARETIYRSLSVKLSGYQFGQQKLAAGIVWDVWNFSMATSSFRLKGKENGSFKALNGQASHIYIPMTIVGINAGTSHADAAGELLQILLGDKKLSWSEAFPVNRTCLEEAFVNTYTDGDQLGVMGVTNDDEECFDMELYWASEEQLAALEQLMEEADSPYMRNEVLENAVYEAGMKVLSGEMDVDDGVEEVAGKAAIYLAE